MYAITDAVTDTTVYALLKNYVTSNKMLHAPNLEDWWYIYDLILLHIYKLLNQTYVLLFGVHIRDLLDKSFCIVTYNSECEQSNSWKFICCTSLTLRNSPL